MSEVAVAQQLAFSGAPQGRLELPRLRDDRLWGQALAASLLIHGILLFGGMWAYWFILPAPVVGPRAIDVTFVELSALDTVLPPPQLPPQEPKARAVIPAPVERAVEPRERTREETRREVKDIVKVKSEPKRMSGDRNQDAPSATTVAASIGGGHEVTQRARVSYHHMVATLLAKAKRYPERAVRGHVTGSGAIRLTLSSTGSVTSIQVATSTQSDILDNELLRMVERAAPFPSFPPEMSQSDVTLLVPVSFRLEN